MPCPTIPGAHQLPHHHLLPSPASLDQLPAAPPNTNGGQQQHETVQDREGKGQGRGNRHTRCAILKKFSFNIWLPNSCCQLCSPHFSLLNHIDPTKMTNVMRRDFPPHRVSFHFECNQEGKAPPRHISFHFECNQEGKAPPCCVSFHFECNREGEAPPRHISFHFECNQEGKAPPLHVSFCFGCNGKGFPPLVISPFILTASGREDTRENVKRAGCTRYARLFLSLFQYIH